MAIAAEAGKQVLLGVPFNVIQIQHSNIGVPTVFAAITLGTSAA
jgi:hypothetical protein